MDAEIDQHIFNAINAVTNNLSILIVSKDSYGRQLRLALNDQQELQKLGYNFAVHVTDNIETIFQVIPKAKISFVIFLIDIQIGGWLESVEKDISCLDETLLFGRSCLVRNYAGPIAGTIGISNEIWELCENNGLHLLVDDLTVPASFYRLAAQILRLMEAACGVNTGMPLFQGTLPGFNESESSSEM